MQEASVFRFEFGLIAVGILAVVGAVSASPDRSSATSGSAWPDHVVERFYESCVGDIADESAAVQQVLCNCQISEMKRWLQPSDMTVHFAAVEQQKAWTEVDAYSSGLSSSEQEAFLRRMNGFRESFLPTCAKAGMDAALSKQDLE